MSFFCEKWYLLNINSILTSHSFQYEILVVLVLNKDLPKGEFDRLYEYIYIYICIYIYIYYLIKSIVFLSYIILYY